MLLLFTAVQDKRMPSTPWKWLDVIAALAGLMDLIFCSMVFAQPNNAAYGKSFSSDRFFLSAFLI
jgi:hypothetical protein